MIRFLPTSSFVVLLFGVVLLSLEHKFSKAIDALSLSASTLKRTQLILASAFVAILLLGNIDAFVLGDGENIFIDIIRSVRHIDVTVRAPLSFYFSKALFFMSDFINPKTALDSASFLSDTITFTMRERSNLEFAFTISGIICFLLFYLMSIRINKLFFNEKSPQLLGLLFLVFSGYFVLFAGYVELYLIPITLNLAFHFTMLRSLDGFRKTFLPATMLALLIVSHFGMIVYIPSFFVLLWMKGRSEWKYSVASVGAFLVAAVGAFFALGIAPSAILRGAFMTSSGSGSHIIPFFTLSDRSQIYTAFSLLHLNDLLNWFLLVNPFAILITGLLWKKRLSTTHPSIILLAVSALSSLGLIFIFNCDLSMILDWDLFAPYSIPVILLSLAFIAVDQSKRIGERLLRIACIGLMVHTSLWLWNLASEGASIGRVESLMNTNTFSPDGLFFATSHLVRYHGKTGNTEKIIDARRRLVDELLPNDPRGYFSLARHYDRINQQSEAMKILKRSIDNKISDYRIDGLYAEHLYQANRYIDAIPFFERYLQRLEPLAFDSALVSNLLSKLAWSYFQISDSVRFEAILRRSLTIDPYNDKSLILLGEYLVETNKLSEAIPILEKALELTNDPRVKERARELLKYCD